MIVFKNYFKIVKKHLGLIIMFAAISIGISVINTNYTSKEDYVNVNPNISIINYDESNLSKNFVDYISDKAEIIEIDNNDKSIQDALYLNKIDTLLIIPNNFGKDFLDGKKISISIKKSTRNMSEYTELLINRYIKIAETCRKSGMAESEIIENIKSITQNEVKVKVASTNKSELDKLAVYYSFENYAFLSIFIFIIGTIMCIFNKETIKKRNAVSSLNTKSFATQLFLGHFVLTISIWLIFVLISIILYKDLMFSINGLLLIINSLLFAFTITSLAYLVGCLIKNQNVISGVQNVLALGLSFISGCFVPIEFLAPNIVKFSKLFPSYWFIHGNYEIVKLSIFNFETIKPIILSFIVVLIFGLFYFLISKILMFKRTNIKLKN